MNFLLRHYPKPSFSTLGVGLEGRSVLFLGTRYGKAGQKARGRFSKAPMINGPVKLSLFT